jgi:predicted RNA-binding protein with PUA-like domain
MNYWLVKSEPDAYSWETFLKEKRTAWTGVRNFQARNNLRAMKRGDLVLFYHSVSDKQIVGIARVDKESYPDATAKEGDWSCVDLVPVKPLSKPVTLETMKDQPALANMALLKQSRLSVTALAGDEFRHLLKLAGTKL